MAAGGFRGGRGNQSSRSRGRGRGGRGGAGRKGFGASRLEVQAEDGNQSESSSSGDDVESHSESGEDDISSDDEAPEAASSTAYASLLQSLTKGDIGGAAKRRKPNDSSVEVIQPKTTAPEAPAPEIDLEASVMLDEVQDSEAETSADEMDAGTAVELDDDDEAISSDPFQSHFGNTEPETLVARAHSAEINEWQTAKEVTASYKEVFSLPKSSPIDTTGVTPGSSNIAADAHIKERLKKAWTRHESSLKSLDGTICQQVMGYRDLLFCKRTTRNAGSMRNLYCLHALNHVFKTRDRVLKNNAKLARNPDANLEFADQGFTRPKVLMILPTRESAYRVVQTIVSLCEPDTEEHRKRFDESFHIAEDKVTSDKPSDFQDLFRGNDDDMFRIGIKFTRKSIKYFSPFYSSDIILASPLGLRQAIGVDDGQKPDYDFLSSIEVAILDQTDALLMQNWEHVEYIFDHMNLSIKDDHGTEFSRVRNWYLEGHAKFYRQTLLFTAFNTPEITKLARLSCRSWAGKVRIEPIYNGVLQDIGVQARQTFVRFDSPSLMSDPEARFSYFTKAIVPSLVKRSKDSVGTLVFIPSYLDFVKVRNYFVSNPSMETLTFGTISEYATIPEASRARSHFFAGRHKVLLYTERAHHFRRYNLKGVQRVIMYGLPENPAFYKEITGVNLLKAEQDSVIEPGQGLVKVMFSKYDAMKLERIVGSSRVGKMMLDRGDTFDFV